ncbi:hypothetical protein, partial [Erwinia amylovora]|uniref:hypothetical protein n=1 Tax=Erwinia amylovora TaxID=552 RepID=UPI001C556C4F
LILSPGDINGLLVFILTFNSKNVLLELDHVFMNIKPYAILLIDIVAIDAIIATARQQKSKTCCQHQLTNTFSS